MWLEDPGLDCDFVQAASAAQRRRVHFDRCDRMPNEVMPLREKAVTTVVEQPELATNDPDLRPECCIWPTPWPNWQDFVKPVVPFCHHTRSCWIIHCRTMVADLLAHARSCRGPKRELSVDYYQGFFNTAEKRRPNCKFCFQVCILDRKYVKIVSCGNRIDKYGDSEFCHQSG